MASFGHSLTHAPQPVHLLESIITESFKLMACSGQMSIHSPQQVHCSWSIAAVTIQDLTVG